MVFKLGKRNTVDSLLLALKRTSPLVNLVTKLQPWGSDLLQDSSSWSRYKNRNSYCQNVSLLLVPIPIGFVEHPITSSVLGNAKGAVAVVISILIFRNPVSLTGMLGYTLTVIGVVLYSEAKKRSK
ncbi:unnamed protein product [Ilex paraguariensis]|uniref:Sugar phosphate transporter domain-containing protein n=1 Tax=Ilex paraguariensis TaxID=185542 RepID=A0ABC8QMS4_9AQUA